jgi:chromosome partitioning protein
MVIMLYYHTHIHINVYGGVVQIISIINQKGGVGKSTTAQNIGVGLKVRGYRVLLIDLDPQGNLSYSLKAPIGKIGSYGLFTGWQVKNLIEICEEVQIIPKDYRITNYRCQKHSNR